MPPSEDDGFKYLLGRYPDETLGLFCPEVLSTRGRPREAVLLATEVPILSHDGSHRLMDLAVRFTWDDGPPVIVTLIEHWSSQYRIDLRRMLRYAAELIVRHPEATVLPIILATDVRLNAQPLVLEHGTSDWMALRLEPRVINLRRPDAIPPGQFGNHVAVLLAALAPATDRIALVQEVVARYLSLSNALEDLRILLPFILHVANLRTDAEIASTYQCLREDHAVLNIIDLIKAEGKAEGWIQAIVELVQAGALPRATAELRLRHLVEQGLANQEQVEAGLLALERIN